MRVPSNVRNVVVVVVIAIVAAGAVWLARGARSHQTSAGVTTQAVARHDIALTIEASGTVEPVDLVEVKSKASGTIIRMPVAAGSHVRAGDLLAQIDTRDVRNQYNQTLAARTAAQAKVDVSRAQKARADGLFSQGVITADEHEAAQLDFANAQSAVVTANTNLDLAKQRLDDATVRAPVSGTVLSQTVTAGQVISSATSSVSGGTALLTMADLKRIRMRALVAETDVGQVRPGQHATVTVDAYPDRTFDGTVEKVEPQAVVAQSVTNFPVLVSLANDDEALLPGMNGEVSLVVDRREGVLAVPIDAVRSLREAMVLAPTLGVNPDSVRARAERRPASRAFSGDSARAAWSRGGGSGGTRGGFGFQRRARGDSTRAGGGSGPGGGSGADAGSGAGGRAQVVFVKTAAGIEPRRVRLGLSDFDWSQVISGVDEGEQVVLLGIAQAQASRTQQQANIRQRVGTGMPGTVGGGGGGGGGGGRSGSGSRPGGGS